MADKRGFPDWNKPFDFQFTRLEESDLELAARRYPPLSQFVVGQVWYFIDGDDTTFGWEKEEDVTGGTTAIGTDSGRVYYGSRSIKTNLTGDAGSWVQASRTFHVPTAPRLGMGIFLAPVSGIGHEMYIQLRATWELSPYKFELRWDTDTGDFSYLDSAGAYQVIANLTPTAGLQNDWSMLQLVVDLETQQYVRAIFGTEQYTIGEDGQADSAASYGDYVKPAFGIELKSNEGTNQFAYWDFLCLTRNEA